MLGSHERRVFFFENGTLLPYCFVFPWNRPSCDRLNGWLRVAARDGKEGNMAASPTGLAWFAVVLCCQSARALGRSGAAECQKRQVRTEVLGSHGHNIYHTRSPGVHSLLVGINLSAGLLSSLGVRTCPEEKKNASRTPIFPKFVLDAAKLARKRGRGGQDENPVAVQLMPPDQSHARLSSR
jgi:hypothetical protein